MKAMPRQALPGIPFLKKKDKTMKKVYVKPEMDIEFICVKETMLAASSMNLKDFVSNSDALSNERQLMEMLEWEGFENDMESLW